MTNTQKGLLEEKLVSNIEFVDNAEVGTNPDYIIFDTCGILNIYHRMDKESKHEFTRNVKDCFPYSELVIPQGVLNELENQYYKKRRCLDGKFLVHHELLNDLYINIDNKEICKLDCEPDTNKKKDIIACMKKANIESNNVRFSPTDQSIIYFTDAFNEEKIWVVSDDSDIYKSIDFRGYNGVIPVCLNPNLMKR